MKTEGWTWSDLAGELMARGIDIDDVGDGPISGNLRQSTVERAAQAIANVYCPDPMNPHGDQEGEK